IYLVNHQKYFEIFARLPFASGAANLLLRIVVIPSTFGILNTRAEEFMLEVLKEFTFEAAHRIPPYSDLHGHSFVVEISVRGEPDPKFGWVASLTSLELCIKRVQQALDHKYLNDIVGLEVPSLENVAHWIWKRLGPELPGLQHISVRRGYPGQAEGCVLHIS